MGQDIKKKYCYVLLMGACGENVAGELNLRMHYQTE